MWQLAWTQLRFRTTAWSRGDLSQPGWQLACTGRAPLGCRHQAGSARSGRLVV
jgi:hypothetical protein